jgi:hypothetical protein
MFVAQKTAIASSAASTARLGARDGWSAAEA